MNGLIQALRSRYACAEGCNCLKIPVTVSLFLYLSNEEKKYLLYFEVSFLQAILSGTILPCLRSDTICIKASVNKISSLVHNTASLRFIESLSSASLMALIFL